jgi:hypothetical protein
LDGSDDSIAPSGLVFGDETNRGCGELRADTRSVRRSARCGEHEDICGIVVAWLRDADQVSGCLGDIAAALEDRRSGCAMQRRAKCDRHVVVDGFAKEFVAKGKIVAILGEHIDRKYFGQRRGEL